MSYDGSLMVVSCGEGVAGVCGRDTSSCRHVERPLGV